MHMFAVADGTPNTVNVPTPVAVVFLFMVALFLVGVLLFFIFNFLRGWKKVLVSVQQHQAIQDDRIFEIAMKIGARLPDPHEEDDRYGVPDRWGTLRPLPPLPGQRRVG
jgi:hypothetical protein